MPEGSVMPPAEGSVVNEGEDGCSALAGVRVSSLLNQCFVMSHQVCRVRVFGGKKPIVVERG